MPRIAAWVKSCESSACVEVSVDTWGVISVRATRRPDVELFFTPEEWDQFLDGVAGGKFSLTALQEARQQVG